MAVHQLPSIGKICICAGLIQLVIAYLSPLFVVSFLNPRCSHWFNVEIRVIIGSIPTFAGPHLFNLILRKKKSSILRGTPPTGPIWFRPDPHSLSREPRHSGTTRVKMPRLMVMVEIASVGKIAWVMSSHGDVHGGYPNSWMVQSGTHSLILI